MFNKLDFSELINNEEKKQIIILKEKINPLNFFIQIDTNSLSNIYRINISYNTVDFEGKKLLFIINYRIPITQKKYLFLHCSALSHNYPNLNLECQSITIDTESKLNDLINFEIFKFEDDFQRDSIEIEKNSIYIDYILADGDIWLDCK